MTRNITTEEALDVLLADQVKDRGIAQQPATGETLETPTGWAFFNVSGYLGTVTIDGDVIMEAKYVAE